MTRPAPAEAAVLEVKGLATHYLTRAGVVKSVDGIDFSLARGEVLALVGESGSGKSVAGLSLMGLIDPPGCIVAGEMRLGADDLRALSPQAMRALRGRRMAMIFQDPTSTLNPVLRIDTQLIEAVQAHERVSRQVARDRALQALQRVGIPAPEQRLLTYPHELSGGMRQRIAIAIAMLHEPAVVIADEPTTALDVTIQGQILFEMQRLCRESRTALLWITHDLAVVAGFADRIAVMYAGRIVESGPAQEIVRRPRHPYTQGLIAAVPVAGTRRGHPLAQIPGNPPTPLHRPPGCAFAPRCAQAQARCREHEPVLSEPEDGFTLRCWFPLSEPSTGGAA